MIENKILVSHETKIIRIYDENMTSREAATIFNNRYNPCIMSQIKSKNYQANLRENRILNMIENLNAHNFLRVLEMEFSNFLDNPLLDDKMHILC